MPQVKFSQATAKLPSGVIDTLATFDHEPDLGVRVLTIGLHPHLMGATHRMPYLLRILALLLARDDTVFMTGGEITEWFIAADQGFAGPE